MMSGRVLRSLGNDVSTHTDAHIYSLTGKSTPFNTHVLTPPPPRLLQIFFFFRGDITYSWGIPALVKLTSKLTRGAQSFTVEILAYHPPAECRNLQSGNGSLKVPLADYIYVYNSFTKTLPATKGKIPQTHTNTLEIAFIKYWICWLIDKHFIALMIFPSDGWSVE